MEQHINQILTNDFSNEQNIDVIKENIAKIQTYFLGEKDDEMGHSIYEFLDDALKEKWENYWDISEDGTMKSKESNYTIKKEDLTMPKCLEHILEKYSYKNKEEITFYFAYLEALRKIGVKKVKIRLDSEEWKFNQ